MHSFMWLEHDPVLGFAANKIPGGFSWTLTSLLSEFLAEAEERFGPRDRDYTPVGIEFYGDIPHLWYPGDRKHISIMLSHNAKRQPARAVYQLAHEVIHLLSPTGGRNAPVVEEGLATQFGSEISKRYQLGFSIGIQSYIDAQQLTERLLAVRPSIIREMREKRPAFHEWDEKFLNDMTGGACAEIANQLCSKFVR